MPAPLLEVCVDSVESALAANAAGAARIELCQALGEGGLSPSAGLLEAVCDRVRLDVAVMIRPRAGDFCYSDAEFEVMQKDLRLARQMGADAMVFGLLNADGRVDQDRTRRLVELSRPLPVTFHRAFDMTRDPFEALEALVQLGISRVLTSGQERSAMEGLDLITDLVQRAGNRITVVPGGGITERNVQKILRQSGASEFHVSASATRESPMTFRNPRIAMGRAVGLPEYQLCGASEPRIRTFLDLADAIQRGST